MSKTIEDLARENDMPPWVAAEAMVRLITRGLVAPPEGVNPGVHVDWLERTYPRPQSTVGRKRSRKELT